MNVLVTDDWIAKIADFGVSKTFQSIRTHSRTRVGTMRWTAPEVLRSESYSFKSDVYSFGMVVWEMWAKELPFIGESFENRVEEAVLRGERPEIPSDVPEMWVEIIQSCWANEASLRPSLREVMLKIRSPS
jgi:serine/threonine protein kinase